ncbi:MAG TPA: phosphoglucosamine mutase [Acidimicrobiales bacterium]|nr:phosphoglucosamine mutase [Acidimicrobiales bacterium]
MLRFGTDGIRGVANSEITPEIALALGRAAARHLAGSPWLLGRDTRRSGPMLLAALAAGLASEGRDVVDAGVIPTPGLAWLAGERGIPAAMVSASHNPFGDNGIKLLGTGGTKLSVQDEVAIQDELEQGLPAEPAAGTDVGAISTDTAGLRSYIERLAAVVPGAAGFAGTVVVDCANGAASVVAPAVFDRLGLDHVVICASPDGTNINAGCGSTHLSVLQGEVARRGASIGLAFDGDADRMLAVDQHGDVVDGDQLIAMFAADLHERGQLVGDHVVVTVLSNLGLRLALSSRGVSLVETPVGDRYVADALEAGGYVLGGEQSGHLIFREHAVTGDGVLTSLKLLELLARRRLPLSELAGVSMQRLPQLMVNVPVRDRHRLEFASAVWDEVTAVEAELGTSGRVVLRSSGTEPAVRVMVEAPTIEEVDRQVRRLAAVVQRELG